MAVLEPGDAAVGAATVVLVVEDDPLVRLFAVELLEEDGFKVLEATNADEALAILQARTDVRVLFTDVNMPGSLDGLALARQVAASRPQVAVLVASGLVTPHLDELPAGARFLAKPYRGHVVLEQVRGATGA